MRKYICLVIIFWNLHVGFAQPKNAIIETDSLLKLLPTDMHDAARIDLL
jgi:hypothetical protein